MIHYYPFMAGLGDLLVASGLWSYRKGPRLQAILFAGAGFFLTVSLPVFLDALASVTSNGPGLTILTFGSLVLLVAVWFEVVHKHKYHRIRTPVFAGSFGIMVVLACADATDMLSNLGHTATATGTALGREINRVQSGKAGAAVTPSSRDEVLAIAVGVIVAVVLLALRFEKGRGKRPAALTGPPALTGGRPLAPPAPRALARRR